MKKLIAPWLGSLAVGAAFAQPAVGVSIGIGQPGVYGRIRIGDQPPPAPVSTRPVVIAPPRFMAREPAPVHVDAAPAHQRDSPVLRSPRRSARRARSPCRRRLSRLALMYRASQT